MGHQMEQNFQNRLEKFVGVEKPPTLAVSTFEAAEFTATRVQWEYSEGGHPTQFDREDGYLICLQRVNMPDQAYWVDQRPMRLGAMRQGQFLLLDLSYQHSSLVPCDVDCISVFISRAVLRQFQAEHDVPTIELRAPHGVSHDDHVTRHLGEALTTSSPRMPSGSSPAIRSEQAPIAARRRSWRGSSAHSTRA